MASYKVPVIHQFEWQKAVKTIMSTPPASPIKGDRYIVGTSGVGDWIGRDDQLAEYNGAQWDYLAPFEGMIIYVNQYDRLIQYNGFWEELISIGREVVQEEHSGKTLTLNDFGKTFTCESETAQIFFLPSVGPEHVGRWFRFVRLGNGKLTIEAADTDRISDSGPGDTIYNDVIGQTWATLTLLLAKADQWVITEGHGTWTTTTS